MQRATLTAGAASGSPSTASEVAKEDVQPDRSIKGPPLASRSHSVRILVMLAINNFLLFMCLFILPAHLLWRQALKRNNSIQEDLAAGIISNSTSSSSNSLLLETVSATGVNSNSATRNIVTAFKLFFKVSQKDTVALAGIQKVIRSSLAAVTLAQGWFVARYKGWWDEAEAMERGDRDEVLKRRKIGIYTRMEEVTTTTFALPIPMILIFLLLVLCGAPITSNHMDTLILSAYLSIFAFFASCTFLGTDEKEWMNAFSLSSNVKSTPRFKLLGTQVTCTLLGALLGSAGHLLDWEKAWQVYPVPTILGSCLGLIVGNCLGFFSYYRAAIATSLRRVELRANPASTSTSKSKKNKKKKR